jgi:hypothetical protein
MLEQTDQRWIQLLDETDKLQKVSVIHASALKSDLYQLLGDEKNMAYWAQNAVKNGDRAVGPALMATGLANLGFASRASEIYPRLLDVRDGQINARYVLGLACGAFSVMVDAANRLASAGGTLDRKELQMLAERATAALQTLGVPESNLRAMMDEAGAIMRGRRLLWLHESPTVLVPSVGESPYLALNYRVDVSPNEAAEMTWELAERLADMGLMPPKVTVGFVGQRTGKASAQE